MDFVNQYEAKTRADAGQVIRAVLTIYEDRTFSFILKQPPMAELIKQRPGSRRAPACRTAEQGSRGGGGPAAADRRAQDANLQIKAPTWRCGSWPARPGVDGRRHGGGARAAPGAASDTGRPSMVSTVTHPTPRAEAIRLVKGFPAAKFDETVEVAFRLGIDTRKQDQALRGRVGLLARHRQERAGRGVRRQGEKAREARDAGADGGGARTRARRDGDEGRDRLRRGGRDAGHDG